MIQTQTVADQLPHPQEREMVTIEDISIETGSE